MKEAWPLLSSKTLTDQVYAVLRDKVISGEWESGRFIREQEISDKLGVSRTPVREALGRLASDGFLERIPHRGFRVPEQSASDLLDLYPILATLEVLAAEKSFPRIGKTELHELRSINEQYEAAYRRTDIREGIEANDRFHHRLSQHCGNARLCEMLDELRAEVMRLEVWAFSNIDKWDVSVREHEDILDAVERGDFAHALATLEQNRLMTYTDISNHIGDRQAFTKTHDSDRDPMAVAPNKANKEED